MDRKDVLHNGLTRHGIKSAWDQVDDMNLGVITLDLDNDELIKNIKKDSCEVFDTYLQKIDLSPKNLILINPTKKNKDTTEVAEKVDLIVKFLNKHVESFTLNDALDKVLEKEANAQTFAETGESLRQKGCYYRALKSFDKSIFLDPYFAWAYERRGSTLRELDRLDESIDSLRKAIELNPSNAWAYAELGESLSKKGQWEDALKEFDIAISKDPQCSWAYERKGAALRELKRFDESINALEKALDLKPDSAWIYAELGESLHRAGKENDAVNAFKEAINQDKRDWWPFERLGALLYKLGRYEQATDALNRALEIDQTKAQIYIELADSLRLSGHNEEALYAIEKALEINPNLLWAKASMAAIYSNLNRCKDALQLINDVLEKDNRYIYAKKIKAIILYRSAEYQDALKIINDALEEEKDNYWGHIFRGWILENLGEVANALKEYENALSLEGRLNLERKKHWALLGCANSYYNIYINNNKNSIDDINKAKMFYEKTLELSRSHMNNMDEYILPVMGWCQFRLGNYDEAIRLFTDALSMYPETLENQFCIGLIFICIDKSDLALEEYEKGLQLSFTQSDPLRRRGLISLALRYLREAITDNPMLDAKEEVKIIRARLESNLVETLT